VTSKLRILQLGKYYYPHSGGIETHLRLLADGLSKSSEVEVLVHNAGRSTVREHVDDIDVTRAATLGRLASTELSPALVRALSTRQYDVVHLHTPNPMGMLAYCLARKPAGHRLIVTHHSDVVRQIWLRRAFQPVFTEVMQRAEAIIVTSARYLETSVELRPYRDKCVVIPYGIPVPEAKAPPLPVAAEFASRHRRRVVLSIGRLVYYKGFDVLLSAMTRIDGALIIAGSGPLEQSLRRQIQALSLTERVLLLGDVSNEQVGRLFPAAQVFALASIARSEAFGIVQLEAMAAGLPIVNTELDSGVPEVSVHGVTGLTVPPGDAQAFSSALNSLLEDAGLRTRLGEAGRIRAKTQFAVEPMIRSIESLYLDSGKGKARARRAS